MTFLTTFLKNGDTASLLKGSQNTLSSDLYVQEIAVIGKDLSEANAEEMASKLALNHENIYKIIWNSLYRDYYPLIKRNKALKW